jgi:alpha-galactosidase
VGVDDEVADAPPIKVTFEVWGDGQRLWQSKEMETGQPAKFVAVDIALVSTLELRIVSVGDSIDYQHADWAGARLEADLVYP